MRGLVPHGARRAPGELRSPEECVALLKFDLMAALSFGVIGVMSALVFQVLVS